MKKIFVTGTGTDVGKTVVSAILTEALNADYWKPIQCGIDPQTDSVYVKGLLSNSRSKTHQETYCLNKPASPDSAAKSEGITIELSRIVLPSTQNTTLIVEGAGGLLVPLNNTETIADLIEHLHAEVVLVSKFYLGSINHTLLTYNELKRRKIVIKGVIFNGEYNSDSADSILRLTGMKLLGKIETENEITKSTVLKYAAQFKNL